MSPVTSQRTAAVTLAPLQANAKVQLDLENGIRRPLTTHEKDAYGNLVKAAQNKSGTMQVKVTGPLKKTDTGFVLQVREFK